MENDQRYFKVDGQVFDIDTILEIIKDSRIELNRNVTHIEWVNDDLDGYFAEYLENQYLALYLGFEEYSEDWSGTWLYDLVEYLNLPKVKKKSRKLKLERIKNDSTRIKR